MRRTFLILALVAIIGCSPKAEKEQYAGEIIFLIAPESTSDTHGEQEVESDVGYLLENVTPYFEKHRIKYEVRRGTPLSLTSLSGASIPVKGGDLPSVGYVLVKPAGEFVVRKGLGTDVDVITDVAEFFKIIEEQSRSHNIWLQPTRKSGAPSVSTPSLGVAAFAVG